jgi:predicted nucleotidyltransferase
MELANDFIDFIELLNNHKVEYMIVGGYAVMAHGQPRYTEDFDIWIKPSDVNAEKMMVVLKEFGFVLKGLSKEDFEVEDMVVQLGYPPLRIDLMGSISGVTFDEAFPHKILRKIGQIEMNFIGLNELVRNKETTGRKKDIVDAEQLKKLVIKKNK